MSRQRCGNLDSLELLSFPLPGLTPALDFAQSMQPEYRRFPAWTRSCAGRRSRAALELSLPRRQGRHRDLGA